MNTGNNEYFDWTITPITNNTTTVSSCGTYTWAANGTTYTTSGTYTFVSGCNTETLVLTIEVASLYFVDTDLDGFGSTVSQLACASSVGYSTNSNDCNDANGSVYPGATEICNSIDDNCNGQTDEGVQTVFFIDNDGDNYGNASVAILGCVQPAGYTADNNDCNDTNAAINPGAIEILGNNIDELSASIGLYPNPTRSDLNIQIDGTLIGNEMYIFDVVGNLVYKQQLLSTQTSISVSNLVSGNYILRIGELVKRFEVIK